MPLKNSKHIAELYALLNRAPAALYQDQELNEALNHAQLLEECAQEIIVSGTYSIKDVLYGRYYWYTKFLSRYEAFYGKNGSMEQAQFKIIEAMDYENLVDSDALEAIEQELGYTN